MIAAYSTPGQTNSLMRTYTIIYNLGAFFGVVIAFCLSGSPMAAVGTSLSVLVCAGFACFLTYGLCPIDSTSPNLGTNPGLLISGLDLRASWKHKDPFWMLLPLLGLLSYLSTPQTYVSEVTNCCNTIHSRIIAPACLTKLQYVVAI